jgi:hypothetical protein
MHQPISIATGYDPLPRFQNDSHVHDKMFYMYNECLLNYLHLSW